MKPVYQIREYGSFNCEKNIDGYTPLPSETFRQLEAFLLSNRGDGDDPLELMGLSARKGVGTIITAKNYVGIIALDDGSVIEIMPKIHSAIDADESGARTKRLLIDMLKTLRRAPYKSLQHAGINIEKMNIFEIFIRMFLDEVFFIAKRGLKCHYEPVEENTTFFKGKMKFSQQIRHNHTHRERCYVEYDAFTANRPENRLLKSTLLYLSGRTASSRNRTDIKTLLHVFSDVEASENPGRDFARYVPDRHTKDYATALQWSRIFLTGKSFTAFAGSEVAAALLFPMETLFESYVAALLKKQLEGTGYSLSVQDKTHHLFVDPEKRFLMKPDLVVRGSGATLVLDTKWKILSDAKANYGISQGDMYQMYAYQKKYDASRIILLYPRTDRIPPDSQIEYRSGDGVTVQVRFIDLFDARNSIAALANAITI